MSVPNGEKLATKQDLADMYQEILPYLGGMPEMLANKFSKGDLYSTEEKMIGQWINGKPMYQKVIYQTNANNFTPNVDIDMGLVSDDLEYGQFVLVETNAGGLSPGWNYGADTYRSIINIFVRQANKHLFVKFARADINEFSAVLQYTKTTDSAISIGSDTDYSTEEKIVGTWIDGSPIWQKTIDCGALPNATSKSIAHGISNFYIPVHVFGAAHRTDGASILLPCVRAKLASSTTDVVMSQFVSIDVDATNIVITTGYDWSAITDKSYVTLQYIKTT